MEQTKASSDTAWSPRPRYADAEPLLVESYARLARCSVDRRAVARTALGDLVTLYAAWDKPDNVQEYRRLLGETVTASKSRSPRSMS